MVFFIASNILILEKGSHDAPVVVQRTHLTHGSSVPQK